MRKMTALLMALILLCTAIPGLTEMPVAEDLPIVQEATAEPTEAPAEIAEDEDPWWNILLLGGDSRSSKSYGRTDSMIILSIHRVTGEIKMTSIMRDTWVNLGEHGNGKINAANVYGGPELAMAAVNQHFGTELEDYVLVNMVGLVGLIDALGGVDIEITSGEKKYINEYAKELAGNANNGKRYKGATSINETGMVHLNGLLALSYTRIRYIGSDYERVMRQQTVLKALAKQVSGIESEELFPLVTKILGMVDTNLSMGEFMTIGVLCMNNDMDAIQQNRIPVDGTFESGMFGDTWCIKPNFEKNAQLLHEFIYGE